MQLFYQYQIETSPEMANKKLTWKMDNSDVSQVWANEAWLGVRDVDTVARVAPVEDLSWQFTVPVVNSRVSPGLSLREPPME